MVLPVGTEFDLIGRRGRGEGPLIPAGLDLSLALLRARNCSVMASNCFELNLPLRDLRSSEILLERTGGSRFTAIALLVSGAIAGEGRGY